MNPRRGRVSASGAVGGLAVGTGGPAVWRDGRIITLPGPPGGMVPASTVTGITADGHDLVGGALVAGGRAATAAPVGDPVADGRMVPLAWRGC